VQVRYERKYLVENHRLDEFRDRLMPFVRPDIYAASESGLPQYTVRSIYYDSPNFNSYHEKMDGLKDRKKLRIRGYDTYQEGCMVFLEIKRKLENRIAKNRALTAYDTLPQLLESGDLQKYIKVKKGLPAEYDDASRFFYNLKKYAQQPANLIVYDREPYHGKFDSGVRITFDKNIRASINPELCDLFNNHGLTYLWKDHFILEIKYFTDYMPKWARSIVEQFGLRHEALSKYATGMDRHKFAMI
jgi:SPX domain protein involved in polyphosphate accumulation